MAISYTHIAKCIYRENGHAQLLSSLLPISDLSKLLSSSQLQLPNPTPILEPPWAARWARIRETTRMATLLHARGTRLEHEGSETEDTGEASARENGGLAGTGNDDGGLVAGRGRAGGVSDG